MHIMATYTQHAYAVREVSVWNISIAISQKWWLRLPATSGSGAFRFRICRYI